MVGTSRNIERSGKREVTQLSRIARKIADVRHFDVDLYQACPKCKRPQVFAESKKWYCGDREWDQMRRHASYYSHGCVALLVVEPDVGPIGVKVFDSSTGAISDICWGGEEYLIRILERARDRHECY